MNVKILYFAGLRDAVGVGSENVILPPEMATVAQVRAHLAARGESWDALAATKNLRAAVNQHMVDGAASVADGDELAFFPPVTGG